MNTSNKHSQSTLIPGEVKKYWYADRGGDIQEEIANEFGLENQLGYVTVLVNDLYFKRLSVSEIEKAIEVRFELPKEKVVPMALEVLGRRCLIVDDIWFEGEVAKKIIELGGKPENFANAVSEFQTAVVAENATEQEPGEQPLAIIDPEAEKQSTKVVFNSQLKEILSKADADLKMELNSRLVLLLMPDSSQQFQHDLLDIMLSNNELLTATQLTTRDGAVEGTISNWLKDYIRFTGAEEVGSSIKRAQYFTEGASVKKLSAQDKALVDNLVDLYVNLRNFYANMENPGQDEVLIFPLTQAELSDYLKREGDEVAEKEEAPVKQSAAIDIASLYADKPEERAGIDKEKQALINKTRKEYDKVADALDDYLLNRKKIGSLACLEILAEIGALDNVLARDVRFQKIMLNYFKRNDLLKEVDAFKKDPLQAKFVKYFLQSVLLERLGLSLNEGARVGARLSNIFRDNGQKKYGRLAYLDLKDSSFKWN